MASRTYRCTGADGCARTEGLAAGAQIVGGCCGTSPEHFGGNREKYPGLSGWQAQSILSQRTET